MKNKRIVSFFRSDNEKIFVQDSTLLLVMLNFRF